MFQNVDKELLKQIDERLFKELKAEVDEHVKDSKVFLTAAKILLKIGCRMKNGETKFRISKQAAQTIRDLVMFGDLEIIEKEDCIGECEYYLDMRDPQNVGAMLRAFSQYLGAIWCSCSVWINQAGKGFIDDVLCTKLKDRDEVVSRLFFYMLSCEVYNCTQDEDFRELLTEFFHSNLDDTTINFNRRHTLELLGLGI